MRSLTERIAELAVAVAPKASCGACWHADLGELVGGPVILAHRPRPPWAKITAMDDERERFIAAALRNDVNRAILDRGHELGVEDWWLVAGAVFQTVWNVIDGRDPRTGIRDYDVFYFDSTDLSWEAEDAVIRRAAVVFGDLDAVIEVRNQARVHLWYEEHFGVPAAPFLSSRDAIDHFASTTCCYGLARAADGAIVTYAPHGYRDLFDQRVRPNPRLAPRDVYERKAARWIREWPRLTVDPWPRGMSAPSISDGPADGGAGARRR